MATGHRPFFESRVRPGVRRKNARCGLQQFGRAIEAARTGHLRGRRPSFPCTDASAPFARNISTICMSARHPEERRDPVLVSLRQMPGADLGAGRDEGRYSPDLVLARGLFERG